MSKTVTLRVITRHGGTVHGLPEDVSDNSIEEITRFLESLGEIIKQPKQLTYLSVKTRHGSAVIHPGDISYMELTSNDEDLVELIREII